MPPPENAGKGTPVNKPRPQRARRHAVDIEESDRTDGTGGRANKAKDAGTDIRKSESLIVPTKSGNLPEGTRGREGEAGSWNRRRER